MNGVANIALEPYFNQFKEGLLFPITPTRFEPTSTDEVKSVILDKASARPITRPEIIEGVVPRYFIYYRSKDYRAMIDDMVFREKKLFPDPRTVKQKSRINDQTLLSTKPWPGGGS